MSEPVPVTDLIHFPGNARNHDLEVIAESLRTNGQYQPIVVQASTMHVIAGNGTLEAARDLLGWEQIDAELIDVSDEEALRMNVVDNRARDKGVYNEHVLRELIGPLAETGELQGTGYDLDAFDDLVARLDEQPAPIDDPGGDNPFGETDEEHAARSGGGGGGTGAGGDRVAPLLLMFTGAEHARYTTALAAVRQPEESQAETVLRILRDAS